jgi:hypothetical protein
MVTCPVCGSEYDERAYQVVIKDLGSFDSVKCADSALRRGARNNLPDELIDVISSARTRSPLRHEPTQTDRSH